jgi:hypothetical protein
MLHKGKVDDFFRSVGKGKAEEKKIWREGERLYSEAQKMGERMPIVFSAADVDSGLIYYAMLEDVEIDSDDATTKYQFVELKIIENPLPRRTLKLKSSGRQMSDKNIRPYAICHTPSFIS